MNSRFPEALLEQIEQCGVISVLVINDANDAVPLAKALLDGGVNVMELTLRTSAALDGLRQIRTHVPEMVAGIGTVLFPEQVDQIADAGAQFAVSPGFSAAVVDRAQQANLPFAPGVLTPTDIEAAIAHGCRELKFFPAVPSGGLDLLKSISAPYAHLGIRFIPLGGINKSSMADWLAHPSVVAVGGSWLTPAEAVQAQNWAEVTARAAAARTIVKQVQDHATA